MGRGKANGMNAGGVLKEKRKISRWAQKSYKKKNFGTALKANPFGGACHAKGIVLEKMYLFK
jgi:small subunit ribosomal protein S23e